MQYNVPKNAPTPVGWQLLLALPEAQEKSKGGIIIPDSTKDVERMASVTALVVSMGKDAYKDETKFPGGPWVSEGEYVIIPRYGGTRFKVGGVEMRLINDADILAVTKAPDHIGGL